MRWRQANASDISVISEISDQVHGDILEDAAIFAERQQLYPAGVHVLEHDGTVCGYTVSHPWRSDSIPALNALIGTIPPDADLFYLHDLALLPAARGTGAAREIVEQLAEHASNHGFVTMGLVAINNSVPFWQRMGFQVVEGVVPLTKLTTYGDASRYMVRLVQPV